MLRLEQLEVCCGEKGQSVLVVDDDPAILDFMGEALTECGLEAWKSSTVRYGMRLVEDQNVDLAVLDFFLPDGTGLELACKIKAMDPTLPIIIMTGQPDGENIRQSLDVAADAYLIKPVGARRFLSLVRELLGRRVHGSPSGSLDVVV